MCCAEQSLLPHAAYTVVPNNGCGVAARCSGSWGTCWEALPVWWCAVMGLPVARKGCKPLQGLLLRVSVGTMRSASLWLTAHASGFGHSTCRPCGVCTLLPSSSSCQALLVLVKRSPPDGRKLLVIGTSSRSEWAGLGSCQYAHSCSDCSGGHGMGAMPCVTIAKGLLAHALCCLVCRTFVSMPRPSAAC